MLLFAKFAGIAVLVWFYLTGKEQGEPPIKWAIIGLIGYWVVWWAIKLSVVAVLASLVAKSPTGTFLVLQIPALVGLIGAFLIRKKLIADALKVK
ncbi:MAG: hypothetical protein WC782_06485 [Methylococcaceae bacterium]|jgi:hypothetical protein